MVHVVCVRGCRRACAHTRVPSCMRQFLSRMDARMHHPPFRSSTSCITPPSDPLHRPTHTHCWNPPFTFTPAALSRFPAGSRAPIRPANGCAQTAPPVVSRPARHAGAQLAPQGARRGGGRGPTFHGEFDASQGRPPAAPAPGAGARGAPLTRRSASEGPQWCECPHSLQRPPSASLRVRPPIFACSSRDGISPTRRTRGGGAAGGGGWRSESPLRRPQP